MNFEPATIGSPAPARDEGPVAVAFNGPVGDLDVHGTIEMERAEGGAYVGNVAWRDSDGASVTTTILGTTDSDVDIGVDLDGDGQEDVIVAPEDCPPGYAPARDSTIASAIAAPICIYLRQRQR